MPYRIEWIVEKRVLLTTFSGKVTKAELCKFIEQIRDEIRSGQPLIYHISDSLDLEKVEISLLALQQLIKSISTFSELSWQIDINYPRALNTMLAAFASQFAGVRTRTMTALDDAVVFLKEIDPTLEIATWTLPAETRSILRDIPVNKSDQVHTR